MKTLLITLLTTIVLTFSVAVGTVAGMVAYDVLIEDKPTIGYEVMRYDA